MYIPSVKFRYESVGRVIDVDVGAQSVVIFVMQVH